MPTYEITAPDGRKFRVTAPEGATREQALERVKKQYSSASAAKAPPSEGSFAGLKREIMNPRESLSPANLASAAVRPIVQGVTAIPGIFADAGMAAWNLATGQQNEMPSAATRQLLDRYTRKPEGLGKGAELVSSALVGARVPAPQMGAKAPEGFKRPLTQAEETFKRGRELGLVVPPSTVRQGPVIGALESIGGKAATQQVASRANQPKFNEVAARTLGLPEKTQITPKLLSDLRERAGRVYNEIGKTGEIAVDAQYLDDLAAIGRQSDEIAQAFPDANVGKSAEVNNLVNSLLRDRFSAKAAMEYVKELRKQASGNLSGANAADPAKRSLGHAQRDAAAALEDMVMRHLQAQGRQDLADAFDNARTLIAKTYSIENALNPATGNIVARDLATQLKKGKPLSDELRTVAEFARAFPKASEEITHSGPISALDAVVTAGGVSMVDPTFIAWPAARIGSRYGILTRPVQNRLLPRDPIRWPPGIIGSTSPILQEIGQ